MRKVHSNVGPGSFNKETFHYMMSKNLYIMFDLHYMMIKHLYIMVNLHYMLIQPHFTMYVSHYIMGYCLIMVDNFIIFANLLYAQTSFNSQTSFYDVTTILHDVDDFARRRITLTPLREILYTCQDYRTYC